VLLRAVLMTSSMSTVPIIAHMFGYFPLDADGEPKLSYLMLVSYIFATGMATAIITSGSMMADVAHENTLKNGVNQEGVFLSAISFSGKLSSGLGHLLAGIFLSLINFPVKTKDPSTIEFSMVQNLGGICLVSAFISIVAIFFYRMYTLSKSDFHPETVDDKCVDKDEIPVTTPV